MTAARLARFKLERRWADHEGNVRKIEARLARRREYTQAIRREANRAQARIDAALFELAEQHERTWSAS